MRHSLIQPVFENRFEAGHKLAEKLKEFAKSSPVVLAVPNGGVAVGLGVALAAGADFDLIISRKLPLPMSPEGGFGSITDDGTVFLDEAMIKHARLTRPQIESQVEKVKANIRQRSLLYHKGGQPLPVLGRTVIVVDDGFASGYTMRAAIASLRKRKPARIIAAAPVGPERVVNELKKLADKVITCVTGTDNPFFVADYYRTWYDTTDNEVLACLKEFSLRRGGGNIQLPDRKKGKPLPQ